MLPLLSSPFCTFFLSSLLFPDLYSAHLSSHAMGEASTRSGAPFALILGCTPDVPGHMASMGWRLRVALGPSSPTTFYPCGLQRPSPDALCVCRRLLEGPAEATPPIRRRAVQARNFRGSPPPAPRPRRDAASPTRLPLFEHRPLR
jgi:hypothetical protein